MHSYEFRTLLEAHRRRLLDRPGDEELQEVETALARIADGSYGRCVECGGQIGRDQLKAFPALERCPRCAG